MNRALVIVWMSGSPHLLIHHHVTLSPPCSSFVDTFLIDFPVETVIIRNLLAVVDTWKETFVNLRFKDDSIDYLFVYIIVLFGGVDKGLCFCGFLANCDSSYFCFIVFFFFVLGFEMFKFCKFVDKFLFLSDLLFF